MPLTDTALRSAKRRPKAFKLFDGGGLYLEVGPAGGKWWRWKYRYGGKEKRLSFGVYPAVSLKSAREKRDAARQQLAAGIDPGAAPIRAIFRDAFEAAGLPYFNPHSLRSTLVRLGEALCQTPEQFKAWNQNLGHEGVLTTFYSYGEVGNRRQGEIIQSLAESRRSEHPDVEEIVRAVARELRSSGSIG